MGCWRALARGYRVETIEDCLTETQTGFQRLRPEPEINASGLRASLTAIHSVAIRVQEQLEALEPLLERVGHRSLTPLRTHSTRKWLERTLAGLILGLDTSFQSG